MNKIPNRTTNGMLIKKVQDVSFLSKSPLIVSPADEEYLIDPKPLWDCLYMYSMHQDNWQNVIIEVINESTNKSSPCLNSKQTNLNRKKLNNVQVLCLLT